MWCAPSITFSRTVSEWASPRFWNVRAIPSGAISCGARASRSSPSKRIEPSSGSASRLMQLKRVVLPAPLGPIRPQISPAVDLERGAVEGDDAPEAHDHILNGQH